MNSKTNNKKETVGGKMKRISILFSFIWIIFLNGYFILEQKGTKELSKITLNEKSISFVVENGEVYIYLKDLIRNGFVLDEETSGSRQDKSIYRYVLWTNDLCDDVVCIETIEAFTLPQEIEIQVYINGLQISCYVLDEELLLNLEEFASISFQKWSLSKKQSFTGTMICDAEGNQRLSETKVAKVSDNMYATLDGNPESTAKFDFKDVSPYFVRIEENEKKDGLEINTVKKGELVQSGKGEFWLEGIFAGESRGISILTLTEEYMDFQAVLENLGLSADMEKGKLIVKGKGNQTSYAAPEPDAIGTLPYYEGRVLKIGLDDRNGEILDCLYTGEVLYISMKDIENRALLRDNGYIYQDYHWDPADKVLD